jgi:hypothetical protein
MRLWWSRLNIHQPMATGLRQAIDQLALLVIQLFVVDETPVALVEPESLFCRDDIVRPPAPGKQSQLWVVPDPQGERWDFHENDYRSSRQKVNALPVHS